MKRTPKNGQCGSRQAYRNTKKFDPNKYRLEKERLPREILLNMTNLCCRRCCEIINWKVEYGKYEPLRRSRKCNICTEKTISLAYHRICQECAKSNGLCAKCQKSPQDALTTDSQGNISQDDDDDLDPEFVESPVGCSNNYNFVDDVPHPELQKLKGLDTRNLFKQLNEYKILEENNRIRGLRERERRTVLRQCNIDDLDSGSDEILDYVK